jgi:hypothetical protein
MPAIALDIQVADYLTDMGNWVRAWRAYADVRFPVPTGESVSFACITDSGASFSVLPYSLWSEMGISWTRWGGQLLTSRGRPVPGALTWQGIACDLGVIEIDLVDANTRAGPFLVVAKLVRQRHRNPVIENNAVLGLNFIIDNWLRLEVDAYRDPPVGCLEWSDYLRSPHTIKSIGDLIRLRGTQVGGLI